MMKHWKEALVYLVLTLTAFYLLPLFICDTGSGMLILLIGLPIVVLACGFVCGIRCGFIWPYPLAVCLLFLPSIFLYYNESAWVYAVAYGVLALIGVCAGGVIYKFVRSK